MYKYSILVSILFFIGLIGKGQDLNMLLDDTFEEPEIPITGTFKTVRLINGYTSEMAAKKDFIFSISHRFGPVNGGAYELFGLDQSTIRFGFEYGIADWISVGIGRSSYEKLYDGFVRLSLAKQSRGKKNFPLSITLMEGMAIKSIKWSNTQLDYPFTARMYYVHELFIARKFNKYFSLQIMPVLVHRNMVKTPEEKNLVTAIGLGGTYNINQWLGISAEYYPVLNGTKDDAYSNSLAFGVEMETGGGHVFQVHLSNSTGMTEKAFIPETTGKWSEGEIALGFNIIRIF